MDWDNLKYFLAVAEAGSLAGAAKQLGVNHSTVFRRIQTFEETLGVRLFDRLRDGYALTVAGEEMLSSAERIRGEVDALDRRLSGQDLRLSGPITVTTTETLVHPFLAPHLAAFREAYPGITLDLVLDSQFFNLNKRQADVAIRPTLSPPETLVGRRLSELAFAVYAAPAFIEAHDMDQGLESLPWIGFEDQLSHLAAARWLREHLPEAPICARGNNLMAIFGCCVAGMGLSLLPCFMGDASPELVRVQAPEADMASALWILTHPDLRATARVRAFMDFMGKSLSGERDLLEGRSPQAAA